MTTTTSTNQLSTFQEAFRNIPQRQGLSGKMRWRVFVTTNEKGTQETLTKLKSKPLNGSAFLGVSGFFSLNAASVRGSQTGEALKYIVIVDLSAHAKNFWEDIQKTMGNVRNRMEFLREMAKLPHQNPERFFPPTSSGTPTEYAISSLMCLAEEFKNGESWLSDDTRFQRIRKIFDEKHFVFIQGSLCDTGLMDNVAKAFDSQGIRLDTIYLSNVREYAEDEASNHPDEIPQLRDSFRKLFPVTTNQTLLIDCEVRPGGMRNPKELRQRVVSAFQSAHIKTTIPYSPGNENDLKMAREIVNRAFPSGMPADPRLRLYWGAFVVYVLIKAKIFNVE